MIHVLAFVTTKPGLREQVLAAFRANMPAVHAEQGCIEYQPVVDAPQGSAIQTPLGDDTFVVLEKWATMADLDQHGASRHMAAYGDRVKDMLASRTIRVLVNAD